MFKDFETSLDNWLVQYGIKKEAAGELPDVQRQAIPDDARASKTVQPPSPLDNSSMSGTKPSVLQDAVGRAASNSPTPVGRAFGGSFGDTKTAMQVVKDIAKANALQKLGFRNPEHRYYAFGPTEALNVAKLLGFYETALHQKYASVKPELRKAKLASDPLVGDLLKLANLGATTVGFIHDMLKGVYTYPLETAAVGALASAAIPKALRASGTFTYQPTDPALTRHHMAYAGNGRAGYTGL